MEKELTKKYMRVHYMFIQKVMISFQIKFVYFYRFNPASLSLSLPLLLSYTSHELTHSLYVGFENSCEAGQSAIYSIGESL